VITRSDAAFKTAGERMGDGVILDSDGSFSSKEASLESIILLVSGRADIAMLLKHARNK